MTQNRNVFLFKHTKELDPPDLVNVATNLLYLHSTTGKGYTVNIITTSEYLTVTNNSNYNKITYPLPHSPSSKFLNNYIRNITKNINLAPKELELFIKVNILCNYGGICLDENSLPIHSLDPLFDIIENEDTDGFFTIDKTNNKKMIKTNILGSKKNTYTFLYWNNVISNMNISIDEIPINIIRSFNETQFNRYRVFDDYISPLYYIHDYLTPKNCLQTQQYTNGNIAIDDMEFARKTLITLDNSILKTDVGIGFFEQNRLINLFINKSFENMELIDYDFIEIGTSNFNTLIETADDNTIGLSVDAVKYYIDVLPDKPNVKKLNIGVSNVNSTIDVYYIPENIINQHNIPDFFKGCNCLHDYHPLHRAYNITHHCIKEEVTVITTYELFYQNKVRNVKFLKIDTEGHDCIILQSLFYYIKYLPVIFYPNKIQFESNEHTDPNTVDKTVNLYLSIGYILESRGYDTIMVFQK